MKIPFSVEEVTADWLSGVLEVPISRVEVLDAHSGTTGRARIRVTGNGVPESLFIKLQPFDAEQRSFLEMIGLGVSEAKLYAEVGDKLPVRVPRVWHASFDLADNSFIMILEDLEASGCRFAKPDDDDVLDIAESLIDELALLHATYWGQELEWLATHALSPAETPEAQERMAMGAVLVQMAVDQFADRMPADFARMAETYISSNHDIVLLWNEGERTLIHGDDHIGNLFVDSGRTGFYDWAVASRYPGARDVSYFLCNSLPTELRRTEEYALLERYREGLAARGVGISAELLSEQYRLFAVYSWLSATTTAAMGSKWQPAEVAIAAMDRTTKAISDLEVLDLLAERIN